ncbi:MAG: dockerin type I repeat-containing protein [Planctomycetota bacterium]
MGVPVFVGDVNCSDKVDFADAIALLDYLLIGGKKGKKALCCAANADANDDGRVCIGDVVAILQFLFCGRGLVAPDGTTIRGMPPRCQLYAASDVVLPRDEPCEP